MAICESRGPNEWPDFHGRWCYIMMCASVPSGWVEQCDVCGCCSLLGGRARGCVVLSVVLVFVFVVLSFVVLLYLSVCRK